MADVVTIRPRAAADLPDLIRALAGQQPHTRYPFEWPLPYPAEQFIVRPGEESAWVAEADGRSVGHVSITTVSDDPLGAIWSAGAERPTAELACVSVLFVDHVLRGTGLGGRLLMTAVDWARANDRTPVLDVVSTADAVAIYRHLGWREVGTFRPEWLPEDEDPVRMLVLPEPAASRQGG